MVDPWRNPMAERGGSWRSVAEQKPEDSRARLGLPCVQWCGLMLSGTRFPYGFYISRASIAITFTWYNAMRVLCISDLHAPYHHPQSLIFLKRLARVFKPDCIINLGDEIDAHCWSKWGKQTGCRGASDELNAARSVLRKLHNVLGSEIKFCNSNHVMRAAKRLEEAGVPDDFLRPVGEVLQAPAGWQWADMWEIDGVSYQHGDGYSGGKELASMKIATDLRMPAVIGHVHTQAGIHYAYNGRSMLWGMNAGCLIDPASPAFAYGKTNRLKPTIGTGVVLEGVPQWVPLT